MEIVIFDKTGLQRAIVKPDDSSEVYQSKQTADQVKLNFVLNDFIDIQIGDYIILPKNGKKYSILKRPSVVESPKRHSYNCIFYGYMHELAKTKVRLTTNKADGTHYTDYTFPLTGNAETFLQFIVENLNRNGYDVKAGTYKDTETTDIIFNDWNVFEAITEISSTLNFDWYIEDNTLHFDKKSIQKAITIKAGRDNGATQITRYEVENQGDLTTVLMGVGSSENMPPRSGSDKNYDSSVLTENRLVFSGVDGESRLEKNVDKYGRIEGTKEFDIKPEFTGSITNEVDLYSFIDQTLEIDVNSQLLDNIQPKIKFLTGKLIGLQFNISANENTITMSEYVDSSGGYPNDVIGYEVGDKYKLFDIAYPQEYIDSAAERLKEATQIELDDLCESKSFYEADIDKVFIKENGYVLEIGDIIRIVSPKFKIDGFYDIKELTNKITKPNEYVIKFGDFLPKNIIAQVNYLRFKTQNSIYNVQTNTVNNTQINNIGDSVEWGSL